MFQMWAKSKYKFIFQLKVEAMYRNELLDDIIGMVKII